MRLAAVVDPDHQVGLLVPDLARGQAAAEPGALAGCQGLGLAQAGIHRTDVGGQAGGLAAEQRAHVAAGVLADDHALAEHRHAAEGLLVAAVAHAQVAVALLQQQARFAVVLQQLLVARMGHRSRAAARDDRLVLLLELAEVLAVQVDAVRGEGAAGEERQAGGGNECLPVEVAIHVIPPNELREAASLRPFTASCIRPCDRLASARAPAGARIPPRLDGP